MCLVGMEDGDRAHARTRKQQVQKNTLIADKKDSKFLNSINAGEKAKYRVCPFYLNWHRTSLLCIDVGIEYGNCILKSAGPPSN